MKYIPTISALKRLTEKNQKFKVILSYKSNTDSVILLRNRVPDFKFKYLSDNTKLERIYHAYLHSSYTKTHFQRLLYSNNKYTQLVH